MGSASDALLIHGAGTEYRILKRVSPTEWILFRDDLGEFVEGGMSLMNRLVAVLEPTSDSFCSEDEAAAIIAERLHDVDWFSAQQHPLAEKVRLHLEPGLWHWNLSAMMISRMIYIWSSCIIKRRPEQDFWLRYTDVVIYTHRERLRVEVILASGVTSFVLMDKPDVSRESASHNGRACRRLCRA